MDRDPEATQQIPFLVEFDEAGKRQIMGVLSGFADSIKRRSFSEDTLEHVRNGIAGLIDNLTAHIREVPDDAAAKTKDGARVVRFVFDLEAFAAAVSALERDLSGFHEDFSVVGCVATTTIEGAGAGVELAPAPVSFGDLISSLEDQRRLAAGGGV